MIFRSLLAEERFQFLRSPVTVAYRSFTCRPRLEAARALTTEGVCYPFLSYNSISGIKQDFEVLKPSHHGKHMGTPALSIVPTQTSEMSLPQLADAYGEANEKLDQLSFTECAGPLRKAAYGKARQEARKPVAGMCSPMPRLRSKPFFLLIYKPFTCKLTAPRTPHSSEIVAFA